MLLNSDATRKGLKSWPGSICASSQWYVATVQSPLQEKQTEEGEWMLSPPSFAAPDNSGCGKKKNPSTTEQALYFQ